MLTSPETTIAIKSGSATTGVQEQKILLVGQKLSTGTAVAKVLDSNVTPNDTDALYGSKSILKMAYDRIRQFNKVTQVDIISLDDPAGGTKATATVDYSGTSSENLTVNYIIGGFNVSFTAVIGDTDSQIATKLDNAINSLAKVPFTSSVSGTTVTIEFIHAGECGNEIMIDEERLPNGISSTIADFSGGAGAVDVSGIFTNISERYQAVIYSDYFDINELVLYTEANFNISNDIKDGVGFITKQDTVVNLEAFGDAHNLKTLVVFGNSDEMRFNDIGTNITAEFVSKRALRLTEDALISDIVSAPQENYGGRSLASLPYFNTPLSMKEPKGRLTQEQVEILENKGITTFAYNNGNKTVLNDVVTTYKKDTAGNDDKTFKYLNYIDTASTVREYWFRSIKRRFAQTRATKGRLVVGKAVSNVESVKGFIVSLYSNDVKEALVQGDKEKVAQFKDSLLVDLDTSTGRYTFSAQIPIVTQARDFAGTIYINFDI